MKAQYTSSEIVGGEHASNLMPEVVNIMLVSDRRLEVM